MTSDLPRVRQGPLNAFVEERRVIVDGTEEMFDGHGSRVMDITVLFANTAYEEEVQN